MNTTVRVELKAKPHCCEEASLASRDFYIPCDNPAVFIVKTSDQAPYRMCEMCADHNVRNRGAKLIGPYEDGTAIEPVDQFSAWRAALASGKPVAYERGSPTAGYYRVRDRNQDRSLRWDACAIWKEDGRWFCMRTGPRRAPIEADEIEELFANCNSTPISFELWTLINEGGAWPEQIATVQTAADLPPHEAAAARLKAQQDAARAWALAIGGKPTTQEDADRAANYAAEFTKIEGRAEKAREAEKQPFLESGRLVDEKWIPTREGAKAAKLWAKRLSDDFAKAETARRKAEADAENAKRQAEFAAKQAEETARAANEERLRKMGVAVPAFAPPPKAVPPRLVAAEPVKLGTTGRRQSLVKVKTYEIEDATSVLLFLAERNLKSTKLLDVALSDARALAEAGIEVPGLKMYELEQIR